ncbi:MAG TPA: CAP domain-containing protein, partial [Conexibacter sp.]|nr:CAP domain-containing protein [Conexibacter sp.]
MRKVAAASLVLLTALVLAFAPSAVLAARHGMRPQERRCSPAGIRAVHGTARVERRVRCLLNRQRARVGLAPLRYDRCLDRSAERHARDMVARRFFAHSSRGGRTLAQRARRAGYVARGTSWRVGENLAWGAGEYGTVRSIFRAWMRS